MEMNPTPSVTAVVLRILFLFGYAFLFAAVEIEIEGPHGWAERLPTWFRVTTPWARLYGILMRGKPLTGYHAVMFVLPLWSFHFGFMAGIPWSWPSEAAALGAYMIWSVTWDLLWFILNPRFGWSRFRKGAVWWHGRTWIGRFPVDYYIAVVISLVFAGSANFTRGNLAVIGDQLALMGGFAVLTVLAWAAAPTYMRWYGYMRRVGADERARCLPDTGAPGPE